MYTPAQVSEMLDIPISTIRRYSVDFSSHFSKRARARGKKRRYSERDILVLKKIREYYGQRLNKNEIEGLLAVMDKKGEDPPAGFSLSLIPAFQQFLEGMESTQKDILSTQEELSKGQDELNKRLGNLEAWREYQRKLAEWERLSWLDRRRTPKPKPPE